MRFLLALLVVMAHAVLLPAVGAAAAPPEPTYASATVDGDAGEWNPSADHFASMHIAGDPRKPTLSGVHLRYDCTSRTLFVLVRQEAGDLPLATNPTSNAWATIDDSPKKQFHDTVGADGNAPDFAWVGRGYDGSSSHARAYEASFELAPGDFTFVAHVNAVDDEGTQTSANVGFRETFGTTALRIRCSAAPTSPAPDLEIVKRQSVVTTSTPGPVPTPPAPSPTVVPAPAPAAAPGRPDDQLTIDKLQRFMGLDPLETKTATVSCADGWLVVDGGALVQHVDQGTGTPADIRVLEARSTSPSAYTFTLANPTLGMAQAQLFVTCAKARTSLGGELILSGETITAATPVGGGTVTVSCPTGHIAVDPGHRFTLGTALVSSRQPTADLTGWTFTVTGDPVASASELSVRCLRATTSDGSALVAGELRRDVTVPAGRTVSEQVTCPVGHKGIVALYDLSRLRGLGHEPQPITRVFSLANPTDTDQPATLGVVCLRATTSAGGDPGPVPTPAPVAPAPVPPPTTSRTPLTTAPLTGTPGARVEYEIVVRNTGETPLTLGPISDPRCDPGTLTGAAAGVLAAGQIATATCSHVLTGDDAAAGSYSNTATATGTPPGGQAITRHSNTVVVTLGETFRALVVGKVQRGTGVSARLRVTVPGTRVSLKAAAVPGGARKGRARTAAAAGPTLATVTRTSARPGTVKLSARLNGRGRRALTKNGRLRLRVVVGVKAPGRKAVRRVSRVTLRR